MEVPFHSLKITKIDELPDSPSFCPRLVEKKENNLQTSDLGTEIQGKSE